MNNKETRLCNSLGIWDCWRRVSSREMMRQGRQGERRRGSGIWSLDTGSMEAWKLGILLSFLVVWLLLMKPPKIDRSFSPGSIRRFRFPKLYLRRTSLFSHTQRTKRKKTLLHKQPCFPRLSLFPSFHLFRE
jgi:hypothetical protein